MTLHCVSAFSDNYIWLLESNNGHCVIVDPGEATAVISFLAEKQLTPSAILITHHHADHVDGIREIKNHYSTLPVYGPKEAENKGVTHIVKNLDIINIEEFSFNVIHTPGHTLGHLCYYCSPYLFSGDTLFSAGCGRLFEGTAQQMYDALIQLRQLPDSTKICCAHEYTASNLRFARSLLPDNELLIAYQELVTELRRQKLSTLPTTMAVEKQINLFLRCDDEHIRQKLNLSNKKSGFVDIFAKMRQLKDNY